MNVYWTKKTFLLGKTSVLWLALVLVMIGVFSVKHHFHIAKNTKERPIKYPSFTQEFENIGNNLSNNKKTGNNYKELGSVKGK